MNELERIQALNRSCTMPTSTPKRFSLHLAGILWTLVRTDFKSRYHGTFGGFIWVLLKPLAMFIVLFSVFSFIFPSDPQYKLNLLIGLFLFDFFTEATKTGLTSLHAKGYLLSKVKFPTWIIVVASVSNALITLAVFVAMLTTFTLVAGQPPSLGSLGLFSFYLLCFAIITIAFSLASSVLFLQYRDLHQVWEVIIQAGFFLAPVVYPLGVIPERYHFFLYLWPPTAAIQFSRAVLVTGSAPTARAHVFLLMETVVLLAIGSGIFRRYAPRAAEYL